MKYLKNYITLSLVIISVFAFSAFKASNADAIVGVWKEQNGNKTIEIYKVENSYSGKIVENLSDNEDKLEVGTVIMKDFIYEDNEWKGTIEIPNRDMSLKGKIILQSANKIKSVATVAFIGKSKIWLRVK